MILDLILGRKSDTHRIVTPQDLDRALRTGAASAAGIDVTPTRAMQQAAVFAAVRVLAESVGQLPCHLYEQRGRNKERATEHPLYTLLHDAPNEFQTAQEWREWAIACLALRGNAFCQIIRTGGRTKRVAELLPIDPSAIAIERGLTLGDYRFRVRIANNETVTLERNDVLHLKLFPLDGIVGASPITYARESIGLAIAAERHGGSLFANGASPGGILTTDQILDEDVQKRIRASWEDRHGGPDNAHRVAVLEAGLKWEAIGMTAEDSQFLETRKFQRSEIAGLFRVPSHLIGDLENATFSNIEHQGLDFVVHALMPYLTRIEQRVALQLLTPEERTTFSAKFQVGGLLRGDSTARSNFYTSGISAGWMSRNEARDLEDLNPVDGLDEMLVPLNMAGDGEAPSDPADKSRR